MLIEVKANREEKKMYRAKMVAQIVVEVDGIPLDGDEQSQERMARALLALEPGESTLWACADNVPRLVTREQFRQALRLAGEEQARLWFL